MSFNELKEVAIEDLLGRDPVQLDWTAIRTRLAGKRVLVTGGGGSIGAELCRQIARLGAESLTCSKSPNTTSTRSSRSCAARIPIFCSTPRSVIAATVPRASACSRNTARGRLPRCRVQARAADEAQVREAFRNNVLGTRVVAKPPIATASAASSSSRPTRPSIRPASWAPPSAPPSCSARTRGAVADAFITVRFGNVLVRRTVVPRFREQIRAGGPVTVTHPEITRYFMTIPEACQLILQAAVLGNGGEIFVLDMGEPVRIRDLAEQMIRLAGKSSEGDIPIVYTGLRPGEKLFEELFHPHENYSDTTHAKIFLAQPRSMSWSILTAQLQAGCCRRARVRRGHAAPRARPAVARVRRSRQATGADIIPIGSRSA